MAASGSSGLLLGWAAPWHWALLLALLVMYSMLVMAESGTLTAGLAPGLLAPVPEGGSIWVFGLKD